MTHKGLRFLPILSLLLLVAAWNAGAARGNELQNLEIVTKTGVHVFSVELVDTPDTLQKGLMFRKELPVGRGMLFDFGREEPVTMWMKNTYIPLDMIFIRGDGRIVRIAENTVPHSTRLIQSGEPVRAVLEVIAGTAREFGIAAGDRVHHRLFRIGR